jgi:hypothetical protein
MFPSLLLRCGEYQGAIGVGKGIGTDSSRSTRNSIRGLVLDPNACLGMSFGLYAIFKRLFRHGTYILL